MTTKLDREFESLTAERRGLNRCIRSLARLQEPAEDLRHRLQRVRVLVELATEAAASAAQVAPAASTPSALARALGRIPRLGRIDGSSLELASSIAALRRSPQEPTGEVFNARSSTFSIPDFLGFLQVQRKTGLLELDLPDEHITLAIEHGDVVDATSDNSPADCRLGAILVEMGAIEQEALDTFCLHHSQEHGRLGQALGAEELISKRELAEALEEQTLRIFQRVHEARDVPFTFRECHPGDGQADLRLHVVKLLLESARQADEARRFEDDIPPALPASLAQSESTPPAGDGALPDQSSRVLR